MNKFWIILSHTYLSRLKSKAFIITTVITLALILGLTNFQKITDLFTDGEKQADNIAVIDQTGELYNRLDASVGTYKDVFLLESFKGSDQEAMEAVKSGKYKGYLKLSYNQNHTPEATYYAMQVAETNISGKLQQAVQQVKITIATEQAGINQQVVQQIYAPVSFEKVALQENAKTAEELNKARGLVYIMLFLIYFAVIMYGNMIANEVAVEKSSRVMEILISSVSPITQMFGKIIGVALLGLTQFALFLVVGYQSLKTREAAMTGEVFNYFGLSDIPISTFVYAIVFFVLGYLLFAMMAAMLGSLVSRIEDAQQIITPMTLLIVAGFMLAMFGLNTPESSLVTITSFIPFFTPMLMFMRVGMLDVPFWQIGISILIMLATIGLFAVVGARVYRGGVLLYGRSSSLKDFKKALELSKKE